MNPTEDPPTSDATNEIREDGIAQGIVELPPPRL
jgi:hypothetical protein